MKTKSGKVSVSSKAKTKMVKSKPTSKAATKPAVKAKAVVKAKPKAKPAAGKALPKNKASAKPAPVAVGVAAPHTSTSARLSAPIVRAGRPSSRLAQLTVPSMAQSVASTAAKASYLQTMSPDVIAPPLPSTIKKDPRLVNNWKSKPAEALSDEELMAMPDSEYMNDKQLGAFRHKLLQLKQDILLQGLEQSLV